MEKQSLLNDSEETSLIASQTVFYQNTCFAITEDGKLYYWGAIATGLPKLFPIDCRFINLLCGGVYSCFIIAMTIDDRVLVWGDNGTGQLGLGHLGPIFTPTELPS